MKVYRSRRRGLLEHMASIINHRYPMRCHACNYRFSVRVDPRRRRRGA